MGKASDRFRKFVISCDLKELNAQGSGEKANGPMKVDEPFKLVAQSRKS